MVCQACALAAVAKVTVPNCSELQTAVSELDHAPMSTGMFAVEEIGDAFVPEVTSAERTPWSWYWYH
jgi:hypothetical protein